MINPFIQFINILVNKLCICKVVISVCLSVRWFVCQIITQEPLDRFSSDFEMGNLGELHVREHALRLILRF